MSSYDEIIQQSQKNIKSLGDKLKDIESLQQDIKELIKQPKLFEQKFLEIVKLAGEFTDALGSATKIYLDGSNEILTSKLSELSHQLKSLEHQVDRLDSLDFEKHFDKFQKTLSEIFGAINAINLNLTNSIQSLTSIVQSLGTIQTANAVNHKETIEVLADFSDETFNQLEIQGREIKETSKILENKIIDLFTQNDLLRKSIESNKLIQLIGLTIIIGLLIHLTI